MVEFTLLEKVKTIFSLIFSSPLFLVLLFGLILIIIDIKFISKQDKTTKWLYTFISIIIIGILIYMYYDSILEIFNIISKNIVTMIYFPSVLNYIIMLVISLGILIYNLANKKIKSNIRVYNSIVFIANMYLFFLILDEIDNNEVDLASKISIYSNDHLMILFEVSVSIFALWIISLILIKIINYFLNKNNKIKVKEVVEEIEMPKKIVIPKEEAIEMPIIKEEPKLEPKIEYVVVEKKNDNDMFTLDEYRQMRAILEVIKENQKGA